MLPLTATNFILLMAFIALTLLCLGIGDRRLAKDRKTSDNIDELFRVMRDTKEDLEQ